LAGNLIDLPISTPPKISHLGRYAAPELPSRHELHVEIFHCIASESWSGNIGDSTRVVSLLLLVGWLVGSDPQYHIETHRVIEQPSVIDGSQNESIQYILNQGFWEAVYNRGRYYCPVLFWFHFFLQNKASRNLTARRISVPESISW
jgi:hypothetical protein